MELKVWVEGIQRIICGVTEYTTCQDIVYALAHATGQTGRFTLIERWRNNERLLAPHEHPLKILNKWGEYSNDVQFVLQRTSIPSANMGSPNANASVLADLSPTGKMSPSKINANTSLLQPKDGNVLNDGQRPLTQYGNNISSTGSETGRNIKKSLTISTGGGYQNHRVGVVRGIPQQKLLTLQPSPVVPTLADLKPTSQTQPPPPYREPPRPKSPGLQQQQQPPPYRAPPSPVGRQSPLTAPSVNSSQEQSSDTKKLNQEITVDGYKALNSARSPLVTNPPNVQAPSSSLASNEEPSQSNYSCVLKPFRKSVSNDDDLEGEHEDVPTGREITTNITLTPQYKELLCLVNQQREKLGSLQADLTKHDAEIAFWESKTREQQHKAEFIAQEGSRLQETSRVLEEQLTALKNIEEEKEISKQQSKTLKSEITLLRSKLANCETELLQCKIKIRRLLEELQLEQRAAAQDEKEEEELRVQEQEQSEAGNELMEQLEQLQKELEEAKAASARDMEAGNELDQEVEALEQLIREKKQQVEQLVHDMKEANLHSLSISPATDEGLRSHLLEGLHRPGSSRRMIGSPRQLENAAPTSKNPHGVWV